MEKIITNGVESRELWFTDEFFPKVTERLQIMLNCIANKTEIQDADYEVLQEVHKWWFEGKFAWSKPLIPGVMETATEIGLFDISNSEKTDNLANFDDARDKILDGKEIVSECSETNKTK